MEYFVVILFLNVVWFFWVRYIGLEKLWLVELRLYWFLVLNIYIIIVCIYKWIIEVNKLYVIKKILDVVFGKIYFL